MKPDDFKNNLKLTIYVLSGLILILLSCSEYNPQPQVIDTLQSQSKTQTEKDVRVTATVLSSEQTEKIFGLSLYKKGIQPVWLQIDNKTPHRLWFPPASLDRDYFAPFEVSYMHHSGFTKESKKQMDAFFHEQAMPNIINPGDVHSGYIFTNLELGTKAFNIELLGDDHRVWDFTFLIPVPGLQVDHREVDWSGLIKKSAKNNIEHLDVLKQHLEEFPGYTTGETPEVFTDPVNIIMIGESHEILYALLRSGWDETASASSYTPSAHSPWEIRYQPVKPLYLYNRPQDAAFRKSRSTLNERNQLRLWISPATYRGKHIFTGQISRIIRRSGRNPFRMEPDVDDARTYILQNLLYAQSVSKFGYIRKTDIATLSNPRHGFNNDPYFTDGHCLVIWISDDPVPLSDIEFVEWEIPEQERKKLLLGE